MKATELFAMKYGLSYFGHSGFDKPDKIEVTLK